MFSLDVACCCLRKVVQGLWEVSSDQGCEGKVCCDYGESLHSTFGIDITRDSPTIHPQNFCHVCKNVLQRAKTEGYQHRTSPFVEGNEHIEDSCNVCHYFDTLQKGGRPRKAKRTPGRPPNNSPRYCYEHI